MIVRPDENSLSLITQPDHAALARRVMERWAPLHDVERRASILLAIEQHDNGWLEPDAAPTVDPATGRIYDFVHIPEERQAVWPRGVSRLADEDVWAAALVAEHAVTVYERYRPDPAWAEFFPRLESLREALTEAAGRSEAQRAHDYAFVRIGDLISLMFCTQWSEPQAYGIWTVTRRGDRVSVTSATSAEPAPDPFGGRDVPIAITARAIPNRAYATDDDLRQAIRESPIVTLHGVVTGELIVAA
jgi:hypothetical protein